MIKITLTWLFENLQLDVQRLIVLADEDITNSSHFLFRAYFQKLKKDDTRGA